MIIPNIEDPIVADPIHSEPVTSTSTEARLVGTVTEQVPPAARHLIHASGCPLYVWWVFGKRRNRADARWNSWFVYLEYRQANGQSRYVQQELTQAQVDDPKIWQRLAQVELPGACISASRACIISH